MHDIGMEELIDYLASLLKEAFADEINMLYFGDPGIFPPAAFADEAGNPRACIALVPRYDRINRARRSAAYEERALGVNIVVLVNMIPFFEALPKEAYGERMLVRLVGKIQTYLAQNELQTLYGRVSSAGIMDIEYGWHNDGADPIRQGAIEFSALVNVPRT